MAPDDPTFEALGGVTELTLVHERLDALRAATRHVASARAAASLSSTVSLDRQLITDGVGPDDRSLTALAVALALCRLDQTLNEFMTDNSSRPET